MTGSSQSARRSKVNALSDPFGWSATGVAWRARAWSQKAREATTALGLALRRGLGFIESETKLIGDSQNYWNDQSDAYLKQNSHWRGVGKFADDSRWLALGRQHLQLYEEFARVLDIKHPLKRIVEWGCGGGMNAIHFGRLAEEFCGIDISSANLEECAKQMTAAGLRNFTPILINAAAPEAVLACVRGPCDLLISTYVFELLPTPEYGLRLLRIACELLTPGGAVIVQIKYSGADQITTSRRWAYAKNLAWNATYKIEEFWQAAERSGFTPMMVKLVPKQPLVNDRNYAYFLLVKDRALSQRGSQNGIDGRLVLP